MPTVNDVLAVKGAKIISIAPATTVLEATQKMNEHLIGSLVVMDGARVVGIFTERDVLRRVVVLQREPSSVRVEEVMTRDVICCHPETDLDEVSTVMKDRRIRHLPVCDQNGELTGLVSIGDINAYNASNQEATIHFLSEYIYGRV